MRAALYARISDDRVGAGLGVARQFEDCRREAARRGYDVVVEHDDNDLSAYSGKPRPGYDALLEDVRQGRVDAAIVWHTDRLTRSPRDLEDVIDACQPNETPVIGVMSGPYDLSSAAGRLQARIAGAVARHESEQKAERVARKHRELAEAGAPASLRGSYGYDQDGNVDEEQAVVIRSLARRLLAGESLRGLTGWLNDTGVPTNRGGSTWSASTVRQILTSGRIAGWREWTPRNAPEKGWEGKTGRGHGDGLLVAPGEWDPIISLAEHEAIRALVMDPDRKTTRRREYLLSGGILKCGRCGKSMNHRVERVRSKRATEDGKRLVLREVSKYACIKQHARGCGRMSIYRSEVDRLVVEAILSVLSEVDFGTGSGPTDSEVADVRRHVTEIETALTELGMERDDGLLTRAEYQARRQRLEIRRDALQRRIPKRDDRHVLLSLPSDAVQLRALWNEMPLDRQRSVVGAVIDRVTILPAKPPKERPPGFDPDRVDLEWRA